MQVRRRGRSPVIPIEVTVEAWIILIGLLFSVWLARSDALGVFIDSAAQFEEIGSFISGMFFTSTLTIAPSVVALSELAQHVALWKVVFIGAAGSVCGDFLIFRLIHSRLAEYIIKAALHQRVRRMLNTMSRGPFWWVVPAVGVLIIASPLPDEVGLLVMGLSRIRHVQFVALSFTMNAVGILLVVLAARAIAG